MKTLFLDSSTPYVRTIVVDSERVLGEISILSRPLKGLHRQAEQLLRMTEIDITQVQCVAVSIGPGSWTGIHIALTTARTFAQILEKPLLPLSQLELLAWENREHDSVLSMVDARHSHAYCQSFRFEGGKPLQIAPPLKKAVSDALDEAVQTCLSTVVAGSGFLENTAIFSKHPGNSIRRGRHLVTAVAIAAAVADKSDQAVEGRDMLALEPLYLIPEGSGPKAGAWKR